MTVSDAARALPTSVSFRKALRLAVLLADHNDYRLRGLECMQKWRNDFVWMSACVDGDGDVRYESKMTDIGLLVGTFSPVYCAAVCSATSLAPSGLSLVSSLMPPINNATCS